MGATTNGKPITRWAGSWAEREIYSAGRRSAASGVAYGDNPHTEPRARLAWSKGHNDERAKIAAERRT